MPASSSLLVATPLGVFTDSAWFQLGYPIVFFLLGFVPFTRRPAPAGTSQPAAPVLPPPSVTQINTSITINWRPGGKGRALSWEWLAGMAVAAFIAATLLAFFLAWLYLHAAGGVVLVIIALIAFGGGGLAGTILGGIRNGRLDGAWWVVLAGLVLCATAILWWCWRAEHPPVEPPGYAILRTVYRQDGLPSGWSSDRTAWLIITEGAGLMALIGATLLLLALVGGLVTRALTPASGALAFVTGTRLRLIGTTTLLALVLLFAHACVEGQVFKSLDPGPRPSSAALLRTRVVAAGGRVSLSYICTQPARVSILIKARHSLRRLGRWHADCQPGPGTATVDVPGAVRDLIVRLTPVANPDGALVMTL